MKLYAKRKPYKRGYFKVDSSHKLFYQLFGNPKGKPVLYVHGGPGGGCSEKAYRYFDPKKFNILLVDQRGAGKSKPFASTKTNKTKFLVEDFKNFLDFLNIKKTYLFGGSWGSTLSLCFAIKYPEMVKGMVLRGIYLSTKEENDYYLKGGVGNHFPEVWDRMLSNVPAKFKRAPAKYYYKMMHSRNKKTAEKYARAWSLFELSALSLEYNFKKAIKFSRSKTALALGKIECYYLLNNCFLPKNYILKNVKKIKHIPLTIIHGRYDCICLPKAAYKLHKALPKSNLFLVTAGHSSSDPAIADKMMKEMKRMAK